MKHTFNPRLLKRSIKELFGAKKPLTTFDRRPDDYYKMVWIDKPFYEVIDYLSIESHKSRKKMVHELLEIGMGYYIGGKISEYNKQAIAARERGEDPTLTHFIIVFSKSHISSFWDITHSGQRCSRSVGYVSSIKVAGSASGTDLLSPR